MNILDNILADKLIEVKHRRDLLSIDQLASLPGFSRDTNSLKKKLLQASFPGIIAEHKRNSPSKGVINAGVNLEEVANGYAEAGAAAMSVLTDNKYFGGMPQDLEMVRHLQPNLPLLRKDFVIDEYQLYEARAWGADLVLLIASALNVKQVNELAQKAHELNLEVLLEIHSEEELSHLNPNVDFVGVNNRNLKTFEVSLQFSELLVNKIPQNFIKISESGIDEAKSVAYLWEMGYKGFLIGEKFMRTPNPGMACRDFNLEIKKLLDI
jgi:indole-3-glycerol phosphate synthase